MQLRLTATEGVGAESGAVSNASACTHAAACAPPAAWAPRGVDTAACVTVCRDHRTLMGLTRFFSFVFATLARKKAASAPTQTSGPIEQWAVHARGVRSRFLPDRDALLSRTSASTLGAQSSGAKARRVGSRSPLTTKVSLSCRVIQGHCGGHYTRHSSRMAPSHKWSTYLTILPPERPKN